MRNADAEAERSQENLIKPRAFDLTGICAFQDPPLCLLEGVGGEEHFWVEQGCDIFFPNQETEVQSLRVRDPLT